jgi:hypothetical protein
MTNINRFLPATAWRGTRAEFDRSHFHLVIPAGMGFTADDLTNPHFWQHHAAKMSVYDMVDAVAADGSFDVQMRVIKKDVGKVFMRVLRRWEDPALVASLAAEAEAAAAAKADAPEKPPGVYDVPEGYRLKKGPRGAWRVHRAHDNAVLYTGTPDYVNALEWARKHASESVAA